MRRNLLLTFVLILCTGAFEAAAQPRTAMYRYQSTAGNQAYAAGQHNKDFIGKADWDQTGLVGYAYAQQAPGTVPLFEITKMTTGGAKFFYTTDMDEANAVMLKDAEWKIGGYNNGKSCYVSPTGQPGTKPVYLYRQPTAGLNWLYIFGDKEHNAFKGVAQKAGIEFVKVAFYVWEKRVDTGDAGSEGAPSDSQKPVSHPWPDEKPPAEKKEPELTFDYKPGPTFDFSMRGALYLNGAKTDAVDTAAKFVAMNGKIVVKKGEAVSCAGELCTFNLGLIVYRTEAGETKATGVSIKTSELPQAYTRVLFKPGEKSKQVVHPYALKVGNNLVYVVLDPQNSTPETDENNNALRVTIVVEP